MKRVNWQSIILFRAPSKVNVTWKCEVNLFEWTKANNWVTNKYIDIINYRFLTTETNLKALYIFCCVFTTSSVKLFVVNVQIFVYNCVFFGKRKNNTHKTFNILKMKAHFEKEPHFEDESLFQNPFIIHWKADQTFTMHL